MRCLDDETVLGLVEGRVAPPVLVEIDEHLDDCASCRDVIANVARVRSAARVLDRGTTLGRYVVGDLLGAGAMGRVYSAWEPELDRRVAIKVLQDDAPGARERLVREAQAMARLDHPNVVGVHEVGTLPDADGVFVAMDLVDGQTLRAWAAENRSWRDIARVLVDIARGLAAVHAAGVLHRDIKPDNVIVGADGRARLGDFGLARSGAVKTAAPAGDTELAVGTPATAIAGTPAYMAPEVLRGGAATEASDQFGFGVTAYEALAGKRPFEGRTWAELARAIEGGAPPSLRGVPGWLDGAIRRTLASDPAKRFPSLSAVADLLAERLVARRPAVWIAAAATAAVLASGATWFAVRDARTPGRSCEIASARIASAWNDYAKRKLGPVDEATLVAIDRWVSAWTTERGATCRAASTEPAPRIAARERCLDRRNAELGALLDRLAVQQAAYATERARHGEHFDRTAESARPITQADRERYLDNVTETPRPGTARLIDALAAFPPAECRAADAGTADALPLDPARAAIVREVEAGLPPVRAAIALGDARPVIDSAAQLVERARASDHAPTLAQALLAHADAQRATSQLDEATTTARAALVAAERGHDDLAAAQAWIALLTLAGDRRDLELVEDFAGVAAAAIERAGSSPRMIAELLRVRGRAAFNRGHHAEARELLAQARTAYAAVAGERSVEVASILTLMGTVERAAGDLDAAERHHRAALALGRELRGPRHPDIARDLHNVAGVLRLRGDLEAAVPLYTEALAIAIETRGERSIEAAITHNSLGLVHMARRDWPAARTELQLARDAFSAAHHGDEAFVEHNLGLVNAATGNHEFALHHFDRAAAGYRATIGADAAAPIRLLLDRARSEAAVGKRADARAHGLQSREAAIAARIGWISADATAFLATLWQPVPYTSPPAVAVEPAVRPDQPTTRPEQAPVPVPPRPPAPPEPQPRRDVGVYGSSQGW